MPCFILGLVSCSVFLRAMKSLGNRMDLTTTCLLTIVALKLMTADSTPKISYMTWLDYYYALCIAYIVAIILVASFEDEVAARYGDPDEDDFRRRDAILAAFLLSWALGHVLLANCIYFGWFSRPWGKVDTVQVMDEGKHQHQALRHRVTVGGTIRHDTE